MSRQTITLVRHGRINVPLTTPIPASAFPDFARTVQNAGIRTHPGPEQALREQAAQTGILVSSDLRRAVESARELAPERELVSEAVFREADVPPNVWGFVPLRPKYWASLSQFRWYLGGWVPGGSSDGESLADARRRARRAAARIAELAAAHDSALLVAHGIINALIAGELRRLGWHGPRIPASRNWAHTTYTAQRTP